MHLEGVIQLINPTQSIGSRGFQKRELVLKTTEKGRDQEILIEFQQAYVDLLDAYKVEDKVRVGIDIKGRKWEQTGQADRYFNTILGWKIEPI
ncbi:MAG: hypothetical protein ACI9FN_001418 [Saprospiraceae bacterium]|jgi:hypothetical protein